MPATYQATVMRSGKNPILDLTPPSELAGDSQRRLLDTLRQYNEDHYASRSDNSNLAARIASYELAWKMQSQAPEDLVRFLRFSFPELQAHCGHVVGLRIAIPRLIPMDKVA